MSLEWRRAVELTSLRCKDGGVPTVAPSLRKRKLNLSATLADLEMTLPVPLLRQLPFAERPGHQRAGWPHSVPHRHCAAGLSRSLAALSKRWASCGFPAGPRPYISLKFAEKMRVAQKTCAALRRMVIVSIGPAYSEMAADLGLSIDLEANPHKLGILVRTAAKYAPAILTKWQMRETAKGAGPLA